MVGFVAACLHPRCSSLHQTWLPVNVMRTSNRKSFMCLSFTKSLLCFFFSHGGSECHPLTGHVCDQPTPRSSLDKHRLIHCNMAAWPPCLMSEQEWGFSSLHSCFKRVPVNFLTRQFGFLRLGCRWAAISQVLKDQTEIKMLISYKHTSQMKSVSRWAAQVHPQTYSSFWIV